MAQGRFKMACGKAILPMACTFLPVPEKSSQVAGRWPQAMWPQYLICVDRQPYKTA